MQHKQREVSYLCGVKLLECLGGVEEMTSEVCAGFSFRWCMGLYVKAVGGEKSKCIGL